MEDRRNDLVSTTAIVVGGVVGIVATIVSLLLSADEESARLQPVEIQPVEVIRSVADGTASTEWADPRGPERGPLELEWEVIATYKPIESMTATTPGDPAIDNALAELRAYANENEDNPYIQEIYLKGLRVAAYYAIEIDHQNRALEMESRFFEHVVRVENRPKIDLEELLMRFQRLERTCDYAAVDVPWSRILYDRLESVGVDLVDDDVIQDAIARCGVAATG